MALDQEVSGRELAEMLFKSFDIKPSDAYEILEHYDIDVKLIDDDSKNRGKVKKKGQWKFTFIVQKDLKTEFLLLTLLGATIHELGFIYKPDYWHTVEVGHCLKLSKLDGVQLGRAERFAQTLMKLMDE